MIMIVCHKCGIEKPIDAFYPSRLAHRPNSPWCKTCCGTYTKHYREANPEKARKACREWARRNPNKVREGNRVQLLKREYGLTPEQYDEILMAQGGVCAVCKTNDWGFRDRAYVDHDHNTGRVRGLLCNSCNRGLGYMRDNPQLLLAAVQYLQ